LIARDAHLIIISISIDLYLYTIIEKKIEHSPIPKDDPPLLSFEWCISLVVEMMEQIPNLNELQNIKTRLEELRHSLNTFSLHPDILWPDMLEKFNVLSGKYYNLSQLIHSSSLRNIAVHPTAITQEQPEIIPNVLLRTRLDPEVEEDLEQLVNQSHVKQLYEVEDESLIMRYLVDLQVKLKSFDALCQLGEELMQELRETIPLKIRIENEMALSSPSNRLANSQALERILVAIYSGAGLRVSPKSADMLPSKP
jgi:hypothetical protein